MALDTLPPATWTAITECRHKATFAGLFDVYVWMDWEDDFWWIYFEIGDRLVGRDTASTLKEGKEKAPGLIRKSLCKFLEAVPNSL